MLETVDLTQAMDRKAYKQQKAGLAIELMALQRRVIEKGIPVAIVFEGWNAAGKGTLINKLILPLDPRGFNVWSALQPNEEERLRPFLWRFWTHAPARGRFTIFDRSWYRRVLNDRVAEEIPEAQVDDAFLDIAALERQWTDDGVVLIKFFLHISKHEQKRRLRKLAANPATAWRVTRDDLRRHKLYHRYARAVEEMLARSRTECAPWTVIPAEDRHTATVEMLKTVTDRLRQAMAGAARGSETSERQNRKGNRTAPVLAAVDLDRTIDEDAYNRKLKARGKTLHDLEHEIYLRRVPVVLVFEGWDAAGKGGAIRRLTQTLDPRGYDVIPIGAPDTTEKAHHYLWRFWTQMPKAGHIAIFDRSWYGRVMVERVEGFCREDEWRRAYREINDMERHMVSFGVVLVKFWLQIDRAEQLSRFRSRAADPHRQWKITDEDWRNRKKWKAYERAVDEMIRRTSTSAAPWTIVESNCKRYARIKTMDTVIRAIRRGLAAG